MQARTANADYQGEVFCPMPASFLRLLKRYGKQNLFPGGARLDYSPVPQGRTVGIVFGLAACRPGRKVLEIWPSRVKLNIRSG
jgi:hypothetical protein